MEKQDITREKLKSNFLKQAIIRLDYDYLFEEQLEGVIKKLYDSFMKKSYRMNSGTLEGLNINVNMEQLMKNEDAGIDFKRKESEPFSSFKNKEENIQIDITKRYSTITVLYENNKKFKNFEKIIEKYNEISNAILNIREGLSFQRIGIKKTNFYILTNLNNINTYFEESLFKLNNMNETLENKKQEEIFYSGKYTIKQDSEITKVNLINKSNGKEIPAYKIVINIDTYNDKVEPKNIELENLNNTLFNVYKENLKEDFLNDLLKENYKNEELIYL